jgi:hypothetical protein
VDPRAGLDNVEKRKFFGKGQNSDRVELDTGASKFFF